ncbi:MFS transporter [Jeotgalibacillus proteolyticus]|uniref:MFS transporter n=1 Tax=Jeotgalibacillus proteolyticus TaxID=2082395 RepID=A0A2S5GDI0_9BACL|nr:MFS transporter [Jeotgalibacillus proteolyticus]PPA70964.1 MFS transporter [Jeotgalibacillus proteolyticus]
MNKSLRWEGWRFPALLLSGMGLSTVGDFVYLVAINLLVLEMTGSAAAVAGLWIVRPAAAIFTRLWAGSIIDRANKRKLMIWTDVICGALVALIPFMPSVWGIYLLLWFISMAKSFFAPASLTYITMLVPEKKRKRFNSFYSLTTSGAFIIGPAIAGMLFIMSSLHMAIWINAVTFFLSAFILLFLPNVDGEKTAGINPLSFQAIKEDFQAVFHFARGQALFLGVLGINLVIMLGTFAMDAQEVVFARQVVNLSEFQYSLLISITGVGAVLGAAAVAVFANRLSVKFLFGGGFLMVSTGYLIYAFSDSFEMIAAGFVLLGFFNAFSNTGYTTWYQHKVPIEIMGRVTSLYGVVLSFFQIVFVLGMGVVADIFSLRLTIIALAFLCLVSTLVLIGMMLHPEKKKVFEGMKEAG